MKVLVIDDDVLDRANARRALLSSGAELEIVERGTVAEGLAEFERQAFDVVLLDYRLPDADGLEALRGLRAGSGVQCPVLILSGLDDESLAQRCLEQGAQEYLIKDEINPRVLYRAVRQACHRFRLEETLRRNNEEIRILAARDPLTGLANRLFFDESLRAAMALAQRHGHPLALLLLDIDQFKYVNDSYGHDAGDQLLREVAARLLGTLRSGDMLCRLGGDEFAVLAHDFENESQVLNLAQRLLVSMHRPIRLATIDVNCSVSIGVSCYPSCATSAEELMKHADLAMYKSKRDGRNQISFFSDDLNIGAMRRVTLERELRASLANHEFELHYQPQFGGPFADIVAVEALLRWRHPERGLLAPLEFLDVAEDSGLIVPIGAWVVREACRQARVWRRGRTRIPVLSVNLSAAQLRNEALPELVGQAIEENDMHPRDLEFEITENAIVQAPDKAARVLQRLVDMGSSIALDDFGAGYSSLSHIRMFPIGVLKIDKSLLHGAGAGSREERLLRSVLSMARSLELQSVVEGVETEEQARVARRYGADRLQGFLLARAVPGHDFGLMLDEAA